MPVGLKTTQSYYILWIPMEENWSRPITRLHWALRDVPQGISKSGLIDVYQLS
jgi:hypothetical protein